MRNQRWLPVLGLSWMVMCSASGLRAVCPEPAGSLSWRWPGSAEDVAVSGDLAYLVTSHHAWAGCDASALLVVDVSEPAAPRLVNEIDIGSVFPCAGLVEIHGGLAYVMADALLVFDLADPAAPQLLGRFEPPGRITDLEPSGDLLFCSHEGGGLVVLDVSDPADIDLVGAFDTGGVVPAWSVGLAGSHLYLATARSDVDGPVIVLDVSDPAAPTEVGTIATLASRLAVVGNLAHLAGRAGLQVFDLSTPAAPEELGSLSFSDSVMVQDIAADGDLVFLGTGDHGLVVIDVSDPEQPVQTTASVPGKVSGVVVIAGRAHLAASQNGYRIVDLAEPASPQVVASLATDGAVEAVAVEDDIAFVAAAGAGLRVVDLAAAVPTEIGSWVGSGLSVDAALADGLAVVAWQEPTSDHRGGLTVVDVTHPASPVELGSWHGELHPSTVAVAGHLACVGGSLGGEGRVWVIDLTDPHDPVELAQVEQWPVSDVALSLPYAYVAAGWAGLRVLDLSEPSAPEEVGLSYAPRFASAVAVSGTTVWVADDEGDVFTRLLLLDVADPTRPKVVARSGGLLVEGVAASRLMGYLVGDDGLSVVDASQPGQLVRAGVAEFDDEATAVAVAGAAAVVGAGDSLEVVDTSCLNTRWLEIAAHLPGSYGSQWRTDLVALNLADGDAEAEIVLHSGDGELRLWQSIPAASQTVVEDLVGQLGHQGKGAVEVRSDQPLIVVGRTYNTSDDGTYGQLADGLPRWRGAGSGDSVSLLGLRQLGDLYRTNISVANTNDFISGAAVELLGSDAAELGRFYANLEPGEAVQELEPFRHRVGRPDLGWGYATARPFDPGISGILVSASVVDSRTNDATTVPLTREPVCELASHCPRRLARLGGMVVNAAALGDGVGYVGGNGEMCVLSLADPSAPWVMGTAQLEEPSGWPVGAIAVSGGHAYVADGHYGLHVVDVSDPGQPTVVGNFATPAPLSCADVVVRGDHAFITSGVGGLVILDVGDPADPVEVGRLEPPLSSWRLAVAGDHVYVAGGDLRVVDISDPTDPVAVASYTVEYGVNDVAVRGELAYLAAWGSGLRILDISEPADPVEVGHYTMWADGIEVAGDLALVTVDYDGVMVLDVADPAAPTMVGSYSVRRVGDQLAVTGDLVCLAAANGIEVVDLGCLDAAPSTQRRYWLEIAAHQAGDHGSLWRTDLVARNLDREADAAVEILLHSDGGEPSLSTIIEPGNQGVFEDVVGLMGHDGKGALEIRSDRPLALFGRIYNDTGAGTFGQAVHAWGSLEGLRAGESAWLPGLRQDEGLYRTNISVTNTGVEVATATVTLFASDGTELVSYPLEVAPHAMVQDLEPFVDRAGQERLGWGFAEVTVQAGDGVLVSASVVDSRTNDATTVAMKR